MPKRKTKPSTVTHSTGKMGEITTVTVEQHRLVERTYTGHGEPPGRIVGHDLLDVLRRSGVISPAEETAGRTYADLYESSGLLPRRDEAKHGILGVVIYSEGEHRCVFERMNKRQAEAYRQWRRAREKLDTHEALICDSVLIFDRIVADTTALERGVKKLAKHFRIGQRTGRVAEIA